jgi:hypothetical protein
VKSRGFLRESLLLFIEITLPLLVLKSYLALRGFRLLRTTLTTNVFYLTKRAGSIKFLRSSEAHGEDFLTD